MATISPVRADSGLAARRSEKFSVPLIVRGRVIEDDELEFGGRRGGLRFCTPDIRKHLASLTLTTPSAMADVHSISFADTLDFFAELGARLNMRTNSHLQQCFEISLRVSALGTDMLRHHYETFHHTCAPEKIREMAELAIGVRYLDGWVPTPLASGCIANVRAFGARAVHILAGNVPAVSLMTIIRNAITHSDAILKTPSNDPFTAVAIARTMIDMDPDHPFVRHLSVAYWKGGDETVEEAIFSPTHIEKIVAWGGVASITHVRKYVQPGIDLITLDPKLSSSIVGAEAFADPDVMADVAQRLAEDIAYYNQEACVNSRVCYVQTGTDVRGLETAGRFGGMVYEAIQALPSTASSRAKTIDPALSEEIDALQIFGDYEIIGGGVEGGIIISPDCEPVEFAHRLSGRIANLVPFDDLDVPVRSVNAYTQTLGIFPDSLKEAIRDRCVFHGAQRLVTLGYAGRAAQAGPHDGIEPLRRMCKWVTDETNPPSVTRPSWR